MTPPLGNLHYPSLETDRLLLTPITLKDAEFYQQAFEQWAVVRNMSARIPWPFPEQGALFYIKNIAFPAIEEGREWHCSIREKSNPQRVIGEVMLGWFQLGEHVDNRGFWLVPEAWGKGIMTEASTVATHFWFRETQAPLLKALKVIGNNASKRISIKQGMRWMGHTQLQCVSGLQPADIWAITREEWFERYGKE